MRIGIYAGAKNAPSAIEAEVRRFVGELGRAGFGVVYGGGATGLMGVIADEGLAAGVEVIGVMPASPDGGERAHPRLSRLEVAPDRERRKARILELADVVVAVPGASGTLEEIVESWSLFRLRVHSTPCAVFGTGGFFDPLLELAESMRAAGFIDDEPPSLFRVSTAEDVMALLDHA